MTADNMFRTVLVANRGEIACRVIRTLRAMGIRSVAVYSDADAGARHVREADAAVRIGPAAAAQSYLSIEAIIRACQDTGAQAVHPGYGFLSENSDFARALDAAGIAFIGPRAEALDVMGDKIRSKNHVAGYGVPVVPGIAEPGMTDEELIAAAAAVGFPLLIKPSAGGGGKGMHAVEQPPDLPAALATARRVAASAFGDDTLFLERLVTSPRHIEVQVLADTHGNVIHLGERECSLQRRHQKVIEEAPSPLLESLSDGEAVRAKIGEAACQAARSVHYTGAGTVEFLVSDDSPDEFFFMEMNTRLQVEHPVTEMVTGMDLVEWQVRIAAGEVLAVGQDDVELNGHAAEARVYAETPHRNFLPSSGEVVLLDEHGGVLPPRERTDAQSEGVRIDSSLLPGLEISSDYDPMLSKVIAWGTDRKAALDKLDAALERYTVLGIDTNVEYLRLLIDDEDVRAGRLDTTLIDRKMPDLEFRNIGDAELTAAALRFWLSEVGAVEPGGGGAAILSPWESARGWRLGAPAPWRMSFGLPGGAMATVAITWQGDAAHAMVRVDDGPELAVRVLGPGLDGFNAGGLAATGLDVITLEVEDQQHTFAIGVSREEHADGGRRRAVRAERVYVGSGGWSCGLEVLTRESRLERVLAAVEREEGAADPEVRSPMPGTVVSVAVRDGDPVTAGQVLLSVEAMKMEHQLVAEVSGTVHITVATGDLVKADQVVATIHAAGTATQDPTDERKEA
ncbi:acetyl-CoA/propionyl-CoA carboxylase biotin carboxyl carrier protein [Arthrobacter globiformis]|uniref:acetyl/propionyl/methylcrotonyl-CoA carboxylase subunit alpha n=1 Tax=Arthrobacter globiformis TaxID=1665 RepID=UPI002781B463|nr:biotin carboxylase N-terminal domain-containing protein [Arthrobacter globiformis]MDQ1057729.1 acetyl-CoA/propionyl-CoA carboxylase biotin carboxyl carrier protein [Arthrobacter globiformis]